MNSDKERELKLFYACAHLFTLMEMALESRLCDEFFNTTHFLPAMNAAEKALKAAMHDSEQFETMIQNSRQVLLSSGPKPTVQQWQDAWLKNKALG